MKKLNPLTIQTARLIIREPKISDAFDMYNNWASDPEVTKFLSWYPHQSVSITELIIRLWLGNKDKQSIDWLIELKEIGQVIGSINFFNVDMKKKKTDIGYCISQKFWNQGIGTEALTHILNFGFKIGFKTIVGYCMEENISSTRVMEKCFMSRFRIVASKSFKEHIDVNMVYYKITSKEWKKVKSKYLPNQ